MSKKETRQIGMDIIRGILTLMIVLYHYTIQYNQSELTPEILKVNWSIAFPYGYTAVVGFFVLSGFFSKALEETYNGQSITYIVKRLLRLYPTFIVCMLTTSIVSFLLAKERYVGFTNIVKNLTMMPRLLRGEAVDGVYWTLQIEIVFYLIVSFLYLFHRVESRRLVICAWIGFSILYGFLGLDKVRYKTVNTIISIVLIPKYSFSFVIGIYARELAKENRTKSYIITIICLAGHYIYNGVVSTLFLALLSIFIIYINVWNKNSVFNTSSNFTRLLVAFARISYPVYLLHQIIGFVIIMLLVKSGIKAEIILIVPLICTITLASVIHNLVEKPSVEYANRIEYLIGEKIRLKGEK